MSIIQTINSIIENNPISVDSLKIALPMPYVLSPNPQLYEKILLVNAVTGVVTVSYTHLTLPTTPYV